MSNWQLGQTMSKGFRVRMTEFHPRLQEFLHGGERLGNIPEWMTIGRMVLIQKDPAKGTQVSNYFPIPCLRTCNAEGTIDRNNWKGT